MEIFLLCKEPTDKLYLHKNQSDVDDSTIMFRAVDQTDKTKSKQNHTRESVRQKSRKRPTQHKILSCKDYS